MNVAHTTSQDRIVILALDGQRYALPLSAVERVIRAVAVTPVPETPAFVFGVVNMAGKMVPVVSLRACFGLPGRPIRPEDQFVIARTSRLTLALVVDEVQGLSAVDAAQTVAVEDALPGGERGVRGLAKLDGGIIQICDMDRLIGQEDQDRLLDCEGVMEGGRPRPPESGDGGPSPSRNE